MCAAARATARAVIERVRGGAEWEGSGAPRSPRRALGKFEYVVGTLWFGRAATTPPPPTKRLGVEEVLRRHE